MGLPLPKEFMCGMSLRTGALVVAYLSLVGSLITVAPVLLFGGDFVTQIHQKVEAEFNATFHPESGMYNYEEKSEDFRIKQKTLDVILDVTLNIVIGIGVFEFLISVLLLIGITKNIRCCILPWLIVSFISCGFCVLADIAVAVLPLITPSSVPIMITVYSYIGSLSTALIGTCMSVYFTLVVYAHYRNLKEGFKSLSGI